MQSVTFSNAAETYTKKPFWLGFGGAAGVRGRGMYGEKRQELARPLRFPEAGQGMRILSHEGETRTRKYAET